MFTKTHIGGGVPLLSEYIPYVHSVSLGIWVKSGSVSDTKETMGIGHFVEHMLFKGTQRRTAYQIAREIDDVGGHLNAYTSKEYTNFYVKVLKDDIELAADVLMDIFLNPVFPADEMEKEKSVVIQEIKMVEDTPDDLIHDLSFQTMWPDHPFGYSILGEIETVGSVTRELLTAYRMKHHTRENIIIGAVGNFEHERLAALLSGPLAAIPAGSPEGIASPQFAARREVFERDIEQVHFIIGFSALPYTHPDRYSQLILNTVLGAGMSSRLFQEVREKRGLAYSIYSFLSPYRDSGALEIYAGTDADSLEELLRISAREIKKLTKKPLSDAELASAKGQIKGNLLLSLESTDARLGRMAKNELYFGRRVEADEIIQSIDRVTAADVLEVARTVINPDQLTAVFLGPVTERDIPEIM
jgi:predicted Zn-dependent peptidase